MTRSFFAFLLLSGLLALLAGCGDDGGGGVVVKTPRVIQTYPEDGAEGVDLATNISVWFSRDMEESSLDSVYFLGRDVAEREYDSSEKKLTLYLDGLLDADSTYRVRVSSFCMDTEGDNLAADYVFGFRAGPFVCEERSDVFEPNDDVATATPIEIGVTYLGLTSCGNAERWDFYSFTLDTAAKVTATTRMRNMDTTYTAWQIYWANANGHYYTTLGTSFEGGDSIASFEYSFLPGTYYVAVWKYYADHHYVVYDLRLDASEPCPDDSYEDNDFWYDAVPMDPGQHDSLRACYLDADYFAVELTTGQTMTVTMSQVTGYTSLRELVIYGPGMSGLVGDTNTDEPKIESWTATEDGTHYIEVRWWSYDQVIYDLDIDVSGP
jgi:hypothetical protein